MQVSLQKLIQKCDIERARAAGMFEAGRSTRMNIDDAIALGTKYGYLRGYAQALEDVSRGSFSGSDLTSLL